MPLDVLLIAFTYALVLILRFNGDRLTREWHRFQFFLPIAVVVHIAANWLAGVYAQAWRYASLVEVRRVFAAGFGAGVVLFALSFAVSTAMPRSVIILGALVVAVSLCGLVLYRPVR